LIANPQGSGRRKRKGARGTRKAKICSHLSAVGSDNLRGDPGYSKKD